MIYLGKKEETKMYNCCGDCIFFDCGYCDNWNDVEDFDSPICNEFKPRYDDWFDDDYYYDDYWW